MRQHFVTLSGVTSITDRSQMIPVRYAIDVYRQVIDTSDMSGPSSAWGLTEFDAFLHVLLEGAHLETGKTYSMQLSDGRTCIFSVLSVVAPGYCEIDITTIEGI